MLNVYEFPGPVPEPRREGVVLALGRYQTVVEAFRVRRGLGARLGLCGNQISGATGDWLIPRRSRAER